MSRDSAAKTIVLVAEAAMKAISMAHVTGKTTSVSLIEA